MNFDDRLFTFTRSILALVQTTVSVVVIVVAVNIRGMFSTVMIQRGTRRNIHERRVPMRTAMCRSRVPITFAVISKPI